MVGKGLIRTVTLCIVYSAHVEILQDLSVIIGQNMLQTVTMSYSMLKLFMDCVIHVCMWSWTQVIFCPIFCSILCFVLATCIVATALRLSLGWSRKT